MGLAALEKRRPSANYREIPGYSGRYAAGDDGTLWSLRGIGRCGSLLSVPRRLKVYPNKVNRYLCVTLCGNSGSKRYAVHQLILLTFVGPCPQYMEGLHGNDRRQDNRLTNLRWGTRQENVDDMFKRGRACIGERRSQAGITNRQARNVKLLLGKLPMPVIAKRYKVPLHTVQNIKRGVAWKHVKI